MQVVIEGKGQGWLEGLVQDERGDTMAVVRLRGHGLFLTIIHPSKVAIEPASMPIRILAIGQE